MKGLETGKDKIQKICDVLRHETLEPARQEAREIVENAQLQAAEIVKESNRKAESLLKAAREEIEEKSRVFRSSLQLACRQGVESLKQNIEEKLFNGTLSEIVTKEMSDPKIIAHLIDSFMKSMQEKGIEEEFIAVIPKEISVRSVNSMLAANVLEMLQKQSVEVGDFTGGVRLKMKGRQISIDITDETVKEIIAGYIRRDFREMIFNS